MIYNFVLALDPSGSYNEGKGTSGWCVFNALDKKITLGGSLKAQSAHSMEAYWQQHINLIDTYHTRYGDKLIVVIEDYLLYNSKATAQINSRMETCKLIGVLQHYCWMRGIPYKMQLAGEVKPRWTDDTLLYKQYLIKKGRNFQLENGAVIDHHCRDAIRHAVHFATFKNKEAK